MPETRPGHAGPPRRFAAAASRRLVALGLVAWLAGLGCLLGCEGPAAAASLKTHAARHAGGNGEAESAEAAESCGAMSAGHGCCHRAKAGAAANSSAAGAGTSSAFVAGASSAAPAGGAGGQVTHCPLSRQTSDPARKVRAQDAPAATKILSQSHGLGSEATRQSTTPRPRAHDRGGTYLRCCVFLI